MTMDCPRCWGKVPVCGKCRGAGKVPDRNLSPHFRLSEILETPTGRARGIANDPPLEAEANLERLCRDLLEPVRALLGGALKVNSGYRSTAVNALIGGSSSSAHTFGLAADIIPATTKVSYPALMDLVIASPVKYDQIILEPGWVHVGLLDPKTQKQRLQRLEMHRVAGKPVYQPYFKRVA